MGHSWTGLSKACEPSLDLQQALLSGQLTFQTLTATPVSHPKPKKLDWTNVPYDTELEHERLQQSQRICSCISPPFQRGCGSSTEFSATTTSAELETSQLSRKHTDGRLEISDRCLQHLP